MFSRRCLSVRHVRLFEPLARQWRTLLRTIIFVTNTLCATISLTKNVCVFFFSKKIEMDLNVSTICYFGHAPPRVQEFQIAGTWLGHAPSHVHMITGEAFLWTTSTLLVESF